MGAKVPDPADIPFAPPQGGGSVNLGGNRASITPLAPRQQGMGGSQVRMEPRPAPQSPSQSFMGSQQQSNPNMGSILDLLRNAS